MKPRLQRERKWKRIFILKNRDTHFVKGINRFDTEGVG